eukprot:4294844-Prymnesium_polylepis.1
MPRRSAVSSSAVNRSLHLNPIGTSTFAPSARVASAAAARQNRSSLSARSDSTLLLNGSCDAAARAAGACVACTGRGACAGGTCGGGACGGGACGGGACGGGACGGGACGGVIAVRGATGGGGIGGGGGACGVDELS